MWESTINFESWQSEAVVWLDFGPELQNKERGPVLQDMLLESVSISEGGALVTSAGHVLGIRLGVGGAVKLHFTSLVYLSLIHI